jgi:hypothetical protein
LPLRINGEAVKHLSSLSQFHGIGDESLIHLAKRRTALHVTDRWVAIALILGNRIPIPVPAPEGRKELKSTEIPVSPKLTVIMGGRIGR